MKKLIITLHDFGISKSVNDGVLYAIKHPNNIATQYSLLPHAPGSELGAQIAKENPDLSFDLCVALTSFNPIGKSYKTLVDKNNQFLKPDTVTWDFSIIDNFDPKEVEEEISLQYEWFLGHVGRKPTALTTQKSEHGDPKILIPLADLAKKEGLPIRTPAWKWFSNYAAQSYVVDLGLKHTQNVFIGCLDWRGRYGYDLETDLDKLVSDIKATDGVSELLIFCGFVDEELFNISSVTWQRGQYLDIIERKMPIVERFRKEFELVDYRNLQ